MQHKTDLRELIEALISISHNPVAMALSDLNKKPDGMRISEFISTYDGLKDGEFLAILASLFGLSFSSGKVYCQTAVGGSLTALLGSVYSALGEPGTKQELLEYLDVKQIASPEISYWRQRLSLLNGIELAVVRAMVRLEANSPEKGRTYQEIAAEAQRGNSGVEVTADCLADLTDKMPIVKDTDSYYLSVEPWSVFEEAIGRE
ncbi:MAG: hypothetical protein DRI39_05490 [Chloroflexi bacterium]|nr:MAG: hypothetical protein DRI39_05490 [Chloroflexota bacterium]RLC93907.1 MAG: hypothetical protein DRI40_08150 [Chloroflexota bacterium]